MNPKDSIEFIAQITQAKSEIIKAVEALKAPWYKDFGPMLGAFIVAAVSGGIAIWSLIRNTNYDRQKRTEDRKKETLHEIRKIYGELVALNIQLINEAIEMNFAKLNYEFYLARLTYLKSSQFNPANSPDFNETDRLFQKNLDLNEQKVRDVNNILHKYISLLAEYRFITGSGAMESLIEEINAMHYELKIKEPFDGKDLKTMVVSLEKQLLDSQAILHRDIGNFGTRVTQIINTEKIAFE